MPKQRYIPLPCEDARRQMVEHEVGKLGSVRSSLLEADIQKTVANTAGQSGSDMKVVMHEACMGPIRGAVVQHGIHKCCPHLCCFVVNMLLHIPLHSSVTRDSAQLHTDTTLMVVLTFPL